MKFIYTTIGTLSLALGIVGIFVPLLPTTPFLLLSAALFFRSSPRLYHRLINQKHLGPYIRNFREHRAIPLHAKLISISMMWLTIGYCITEIIPHVAVKIVLLLTAIAVSIYILSHKTLKKQ